MGMGRVCVLNSRALLSPCCHSCHQAILWLPDATEASHPAYHAPTAAGLHAGRAQAQTLELLAEHQQADTLPEMRTAPRLCLNPFWESTLSTSPRRWSPGSSNPLFTEDGTCAPAFSIYLADQLTPWLWGERPHACSHTCASVLGPSEPALHSTQKTDFQEEMRMEPDLFHLKRFCLSAVLWIIPFCCEHRCCLAAAQPTSSAPRWHAQNNSSVLLTLYVLQGGAKPFRSLFPTFHLKDTILLHPSN